MLPSSVPLPPGPLHPIDSAALQSVPNTPLPTGAGALAPQASSKLHVSPASPGLEVPDLTTVPAKPRFDPRWKVLYLLTLTVGVFAIPGPMRWYAVPALVLFQVGLLLALRVPFRAVYRIVTRLKGVFLFLIGCYLLLPGKEGSEVFSLPLGVFDWALDLNLTGLRTAILMCCQILAVLLASAVVLLTGSESDLVEGLRRLWCPRLLMYSVDNTLALLGGLDRPGHGGRRGQGSGTGGMRVGRRNNQPGEAEADSVRAGPGFLAITRRLLRGDAGLLIEAIKSGMKRASERNQRTMGQASVEERRLAHDVTIISGIAVVMMSMKLFKFLPGIPFAPAHKTLILIPLYILAAQLTYSRFGGTTAGAIMGLVNFLNGNGRFGLFDVLKHMVPGLAIDLLWPVFRRLPRKIWVYSVLGILTAICRISTELAVGLLLGARWEVFLGLTWRICSNLLAGGLSGAVTYSILPAFRSLEPAQFGAAPEPGPAPAPTFDPGQKEPSHQTERVAPPSAPPG